MEDAEPQSLFELLRAPAVVAPGSLREQLDLIRIKWRRLIGESLDRLLSIAGEILHEEDLAIWLQFNPPNAATEAAARAAAEAAAAAAAQRRRESGQQQWPSTVSQSEVLQFGEVQPGRGLDAGRRVDRQEHLRLARTAQQATPEVD
jgi:hypothetical protein